VLSIAIPEREFYDEAKQEFVKAKGESLQLEHSLVSISKWESAWRKPFLDKSREKTDEETIDYIRCMTINQNVSPATYQYLPGGVYRQITDYINDAMTATWFADQKEAKKSGEVITSELIYYWMIAHGIPMECQKWHLNRLLTLIRVCNIKSQPPKKMGRKAMLSRRRALNEARRSQYNTRG
jgi:hypothetical protein